MNTQYDIDVAEYDIVDYYAGSNHQKFVNIAIVSMNAMNIL